MIRLLLETATDVCSVAVARGEELVAERTAPEVHQHASHLTLFIRDVMDAAGIRMTELEEIVLSDGPGSYTSLRVGAATAKGLCVALPGLKLRVVPTLLSLALASGATGIVLATINSRRGEVFGQLFTLGPRPTGSVEPRPPVQSQDKEAGEDSLWTAPQNIRLTEEGFADRLQAEAGTTEFTVTGPGQARFLEHFTVSGQIRAAGPERCSARHLLAPVLFPAPASAPASSRAVDVAGYEPFYLNPPFVTKSKKKLLGR